MHKPAHNDHPILDLLQARWSPYAFAETPVEPGKLLSLLEAARWSASCFNDQPWFFIVATHDEPENFDKIVGCLNDSARRWAPQAPVLMLTVARETFAVDGSPNQLAQYDLGQAVATMTVQATSLGLLVHQVAGIYPDKAREVFAIPDGYRVMTAIAIGYYGDPDALHEKDQRKNAQPRERKPLDSFVFGGAWGESAKLVKK